MCLFKLGGSYLTDFMMPNIIFCQRLHYSFLPFSASLLLYQRKISQPPTFLSGGNTNPKCFIQLKGSSVRRKIVPPFIRHRFFLCCFSTQRACLTYSFPNYPNYLFSKNMLPLDKPIKYILSYPLAKSFFHKLC